MDLPEDVINIILKFRSNWNLCKVDKRYKAICDNFYKTYINETRPGLTKTDFPIPYNFGYLQLIGGKLYKSELTFIRGKITSNIKPILVNSKHEYKNIYGSLLQDTLNNFYDITGNVISVDKLSLPTYSRNNIFDKYHIYYNNNIYTLDFKMLCSNIHMYLFMMFNYGMLNIDELCKGTYTHYYPSQEARSLFIHNINNLSCCVGYITSVRNKAFASDDIGYVILGYIDGTIDIRKFYDPKFSHFAFIPVDNYPIIEIIPIMVNDYIIDLYILDAKGSLYHYNWLSNIGKFTLTKIDTNVNKIKEFKTGGIFKINGVFIIKQNKITLRVHNSDSIESVDFDFNKSILDVEYIENDLYLLLGEL